MTNPTKIGIIGCGNISSIYLEMAQKFDILAVAACADLDIGLAQAQATKFNVPKACTTEHLLADPEIEIVVNLTPPQAHAGIALQTINAGKSIYNEKPLALTRPEAQQILTAAKKKGVRVGCAPDTFLGAGLQTARKLLDDGWIGQPIGATAFMLCAGPETWHPSPAFLYQKGAGPMFDMGPYYLTALVSLLGPITRVSGFARKTFAQRTITSQPRYGQKIKVNTPTYVASVLEFASGPIGTLITSFDVPIHSLPFIEIYGTVGTLNLPDPNTFAGPVRFRNAGMESWNEIPLTHNYKANWRSLGVADMAYGIRSGRPHRASGEMAYHILDILHATQETANAGKHIPIASTCTRPAPLEVSPFGKGDISDIRHI